jgi:predicted XRE-type DNA-binding protein
MIKKYIGNIVPFPRRKRAKARSPRVTPEMAEQMRSMYAQGMAQHEIAAHFQVNQGRVSDAVNYRC